MAGNDVAFSCNDKNAEACAKLDTKPKDGKVTVAELTGSKVALFKDAFSALDSASQGKTLLSLAAAGSDDRFVAAFNTLYPLGTPLPKKQDHLDKVAETLVTSVAEMQKEGVSHDAAVKKVEAFYLKLDKAGNHGDINMSVKKAKQLGVRETYGSLGIDSQISITADKLVEKSLTGKTKDFVKKVFDEISHGG